MMKDKIILWYYWRHRKQVTGTDIVNRTRSVQHTHTNKRQNTMKMYNELE